MLSNISPKVLFEDASSETLLLLNSNIAKMFLWVRLFCRLGVPPRAPRRDLLQQLLSNILRLGSCYSLNACASYSSPPASSLSVRPLRHSDSLPPQKKTHPDSLTFRPNHTQTLSQSDLLTTSSVALRLTHRLTHTQTHSLRALAHRDTLTISLFIFRFMHSGHPKG